MGKFDFPSGRWKIPAQLAAAIIVGIALRFVVSLHPVWWLAWIAPAPLLALAIASRRRDARWITALATLIAYSVNFPYLQLVMPPLAAVVIIAAQSLQWTFIVLASRRLILRYRAAWTVLAYPLLWVAMDTLQATLLPDGNWGSLAYSQGDVLPLLQITSLFGVGGLLFLLTLLPSALALAVVLRPALAPAMGRESRKLWPALAGTIVLIAAALVFGTLRLQAPVSGPAVSFGLAAIDDAIGSKAAPAYVRAIRDRYDQLIDALAGQGAAIILLPEKIALLSRAEAEPWQQHLAAKAAENHVWLAAGMGVDDGGKRVNLSWLFAPDGAQVGRYQKQHLAPPEREFIAGTAFELHAIGSRQYGIAICKDMHFASLARGYGQRQAAAMLVPAWDFYFDGWLAARMTAMRGVENGFMVIRASREGTLMVSDAYGRIIAEQPSRAMPGASLLVKATVAEPVATLYTRVGDAFAWLCLVAAAVLLVIGRRNPRNGVGEG